MDIGAFLFIILAMTILEKIIGSPSRLKVVRFFLQNPAKVVTARELAKILQISSPSASRDLAFTKSIELVKPSTRLDIIERKGKSKRKKISGFVLSSDFAFFQPMHNLVIGASPVSREKMTKYFKSKKAIQLVALGGVFVQETNFPKNILPSEGDVEKDNRLDLLIVANKIKKNNIEPFIKKIECEIGKELVWALFSEREFEYRSGMHDKFLRDLFDYPHEILINKI